MMMSPGNGNYNKKQISQRLILLVFAVGMAAVSVMFLHKLSEARVFGILPQDQDQQILKLHFILQREWEKSREMKRKLGDTRDKNLILKSQKMGLTQKLMETQTTSYQLQKIQKEMEASLEEKQNQINSLSSKMEESFSTNLQVADLTERLKQKESEVEELKHQLNKPTTQNTSDEVMTKQNEEQTPKEQWVSLQTNANENGERNEMSEEGKVSEVKEHREDEKTENGEKGKEPSIEEDLNKEEPKRRRSKTRSKGRRRRATPNGKEMEKNSDGQSSKPQNEYNVNNSTMEGEQKELATEAGKLEISKGSRVERNNGEGTTEAGGKNPVSSEQEGGNDRIQEDREGSKVDEGHSTDKIVEGEGKDITTMQSEKSENTQEDEAKKEKTEDPQDNEAKNEKIENPLDDEANNEKSENLQNDEARNEKFEIPQDDEAKNVKVENPQDDEVKNEKSENLQNDEDKNEKSEKLQNDEDKNEKSENPQGDEAKNGKTANPQGDEAKNEKSEDPQDIESKNEKSENPEDDEAKNDADNSADKNQIQISESTDDSSSIEELNNEEDPET